MDDSEGLVFAHLLGLDPNNRKMTWTDVDQWTGRQGLLWIHLDVNNDTAVNWLKYKSGFGPLVQEGLLEQGTRPRSRIFSEGTLVILRGVNCNPGEDPEDMVALRMLISNERIITMRRDRVMAVSDTHEAVVAGEGPQTASEFFIMVLDFLSERIGTVLTDLEDQVAEVEDAIVTEEIGDLRPLLAKLRRQSISLRRYIAPQRDMLGRLLHEKIDWLAETDRGVMREIVEQTARFVDDIDATRELALIAQEELKHHLAEQMNRAMYMMSIVAAIFLPLGLITGLLGINVGGIPGSDNPWAFLAVTLLLLSLALVLILWFRKIKWL